MQKMMVVPAKMKHDKDEKDSSQPLKTDQEKISKYFRSVFVAQSPESSKSYWGRKIAQQPRLCQAIILYATPRNIFHVPWLHQANYFMLMYQVKCDTLMYHWHNILHTVLLYCDVGKKHY